jgi:hypothetical protein
MFGFDVTVRSGLQLRNFWLKQTICIIIAKYLLVLCNMFEMHPETAEELLDYGKPFIYGIASAAVSQLLFESTTPLSDKYKDQLSIRNEIRILERQVDAIESVNAILETSSVDNSEMLVRKNTLSTLRAQKDELGSETVNFVQGYGASIAVGLTVVTVGLKRALSKR